MQRPQFGTRVGSQPVREQLPYGLVGGQCLRRAARVAQGAQAEALEGFVEGVGVAQGGQFGESLVGLAEGEGGGVPGAQGVQSAGLGAGRLGRAVGQIGQRRTPPQGEGVVQDHGRLRGVAVGQRPHAVTGEPLETVQVDVVRRGRQPVTAVHGRHRVRADRPPQPPHQRLHRARRVGRRVAVPHLVHQEAHRDGPAGPQSEHGQQRTQARPADRDGRTVGAECLRGAEDAIAHGVHCLW